MNKDEIISHIADNIRLERLKRRYSQEKLSELADITQKYLANIENKKVNPSIVVIVKLCEALKIDLNSLLTF